MRNEHSGPTGSERPIYVNTADGIVGPDEIILRMGFSPGPAEGAASSRRAGVQLVLPPRTAKWLSLSLNHILEAYEQLFGFFPSRPVPGGELGLAMAAAVGQLGLEYGYERSLRISPGVVLPNRFLMTFGKGDLGIGAQERIMDLCRALGMPQEFLAPAQQRLSGARIIHAGFEQGLHDCIYKVYFETDLKKAELVRAEPVLQHVAYKWSAAGSGKRAVTEYMLHPGLTYEEIAARIAGIYGPADAGAMKLVRSVLGAVEARTAAQNLSYLEVSEEGNPRRSFALTMYRAQVRLGEVTHILRAMFERYELGTDLMEQLCGGVWDRMFGNFGGGIHRDGSDFFTIYYGVEGRRDCL